MKDNNENENVIGDYDKIMSDRNIFNQVVYTPLSDALRLLDERQKDKELVSKIEKLLNGDIPEILKNKKCGVQFRQIATPNNDAKYFKKIAEGFGLTPVYLEYHSDKFSSNNYFKRSLGQLQIQGPVNKKDEYRVQKLGVIDFNKHNGKVLKDAVTHWQEPLIHFHRRLFYASDAGNSINTFYDMSNWVKKHGATPEKYYIDFLYLFTCFGILFENFPIEGEDAEFTKNVILPSIDKIIKETNIKPLIVPVGPMDMENDNYWTLYNEEIKNFINNK